MRGQGQPQILFSYMALLSVKAKLSPATPCSYLFPTINRAEKASGEWHHCSFKEALGREQLYPRHSMASLGTRPDVASGTACVQPALLPRLQ